MSDPGRSDSPIPGAIDRLADDFMPVFGTHDRAVNAVSMALTGVWKARRERVPDLPLAGVGVDPVARLVAMGIVYRMAGKFDHAERALRRALELDPSDPAAVGFMESLLKLRTDDGNGWRVRPGGAFVRRPVPWAPGGTPPHWDGQAGGGRRLLIDGWAVGAGDFLQYVLRYLPAVVALDWRVAVEVPGALRRLVAGLPDLRGIEWVAQDAAPCRDDAPVWGSGYDARCWGMTLPAYAGGADTLWPAPEKVGGRPVPYLTPDPLLALSWRLRLADAGPARLRVGVCWRSAADVAVDPRGASLADFAPLAAVRGARFVALWKAEALDPACTNPEARRSQFEPAPPGMLLDRVGPEFHDLADAAAAIAGLDAIVCTDNVIAHLAGAMGRPTWLLLTTRPEGRWRLSGPTTPWYPTLKLVRQRLAGDWGPVVAEVRDELAHMAAAKGVA